MSQLCAQSYFPPNGSATWETVSTGELGWCQEAIDTLNNYLESRSTKGFIILKSGKIAMESYYNGHSVTLPWYWASAGKSLVAVLTGIAQEEGLLSIEDSVSTYLGEGWTSCSPEDEGLRKIRHQLSMTSTFNNTPFFWDCSEPACFVCAGDPDGQWHYHNGVYKRIHDVLQAASGQTMNAYTAQKVGIPIGMTGLWNSDALFFSTTRSMARFGLLALNDFIWNGTEILGDTGYINAMRNPSNPYNPSYGYLWWLNGQSSHMLPLNPTVYDGSIIPPAPADLYGGFGADDQRVYVIPSLDMVVVRMGDEAYENVPTLSAFDPELWDLINALPCQVTNTLNREGPNGILTCFPNPSAGSFDILDKAEFTAVRIFDGAGRLVKAISPQTQTGQITLPSGIYFVEGIKGDHSVQTGKIIVL